MPTKYPKVPLVKPTPKISLRTVLIVPFVLQIFAAVGLVGWLSFRNGQTVVNDLATQLRAEISERIRQHLQTYTATPPLINEINATALKQSLLNIQNPNSMATYFWQQGKVFQGLGTIAFASESGDFVGANKTEGYVTFANESTDRAIVRYAADEPGNYSQLIRSRPNYDPRKRSWYKMAQKVGHPTWTPIEPSFSSRRLDATAVYPFYNETGTLQGVFMAEHSLSQIGNFLRRLKIGKSGQTFIVERSGLLVASSTQQEPFLIKGQEIERIQAEKSNDVLVQSTAQHLAERFGTLSQIHSPIQLDFLLNGERQFLQIVPFSDPQGLDWLIVVIVPEADFMEQINANTRTTILLCIVALVVAIIFGIFTTRGITQPIQRLRAASTAIAAGELDQKVEIKSINELGALAQSFNQMAQQLRESFTALEKANAELEISVDRRTAELKAANQEILQLNQRLKTENIRMSAELEVTRQLQIMILPKEEELQQIPELDMAGFMEPAQEIGGDYYDIIRQNDRIKISIGDVTGHGLESGVLMIMVQTALRTLLAHNETDPVKLLTTLNHTIYENVQRMNSDKTLSLSLLDYFQGTLSLSGQHEEIIVLRSGGEVERIDTIDLGFPIGLKANILEDVGVVSVPLNAGDVVVLYTDGITEAENMNRRQYGLERLIEVIKLNWQRSADDIRQAVIHDLREHIGAQKVYDDITLVVFKRK